MAINYIQRFALSSANMLTPAQYLADPQRLIGHQSGTARSPLENRALHDTSLMTCALALFAANNQDQDITSSLTEAQIAAFLKDAIRSVAETDNNVKKTTDQTIAGIKTFTSSPVVPTPTTATQAANKDYVDASITNSSAGYMRIGTFAGPNVNETIYGEKYFQEKVQVPTEAIFDISTSAVNTEFLKRRGNEYRDYLQIATPNHAFADSDFGRIRGFVGSLGATRVGSLPNITGAARAGCIITIGSYTNDLCRIDVAAGGEIAAGGQALTSVIIGRGETASLINTGSNYWILFGDASEKYKAQFFSQTIGNTHVQVISGSGGTTGTGKMIITGETANIVGDTNVTITFPHAFSSPPIVVAGIRYGLIANQETFGKVIGTPTTTQVVLRSEAIFVVSGNQFVTYI